MTISIMKISVIEPLSKYKKCFWQKNRITNEIPLYMFVAEILDETMGKLML